MNVDKLQFIDLGLPSGKLWATENFKDENGNEAYYTFDDAVQTFGENLPSREDWKELFNICSYKWNKKKKGYDVTGPNSNSIFLPAAGYRSDVSMKYIGSDGYYWSSSVYDENGAYCVNFYSGNLNPQNNGYRFVGFSVRLVR